MSKKYDKLQNEIYVLQNELKKIRNQTRLEEWFYALRDEIADVKQRVVFYPRNINDVAHDILEYLGLEYTHQQECKLIKKKK